jgi:DNA-binding NarL/FixJ family response regulator
MGVGAADPIRVFLVDARELVRLGIASVLAVQGGLEVVGEAARAADAPARIRATRPDVVVLGDHLPDAVGVDLCRELLAEPEPPACLLLGDRTEDGVQYDAAHNAAALAGAAGWLPDDVHGGELVEALTAIAKGEHLHEGRGGLSEPPPVHTDPPPDPLDGLGGTDRDIVALIGEGLTNRQIGDRLGLSERTIKNHVSRVLAFLEMERRTQIAALAASTHRE